jgi:hypothetical protein
MRIDSSGNLLVGTTSANPQSRASGEGVQLSPDFIGVGRFQNPALYLNRQNNDGDVAVFRKDGTTVGSIGTVNGDIYLGTGNVNLRFTDSANDIRPVNSSGVNLDNTVDLGASATRFKDLYLSGGVKGNNLTFSGNGSSEHAKIDSSGRVGIGTSSPASKLHVSSTDSVSITQTHTDGNTVSFKQSGTGGDVEWRNGNGEALIMTGSQTRMTVDSSGNVGIGTSNPAALLHLESASAPTLKIDDSDSVLALELAQDGADGSMLLGSAGVLTIGVTNNSSSDTVAFQTKSTERMRIDSSGRLALGTTTAGAKFHAVDGGAVTGILESTGALGSILSFKDSNTASLTAAAIGCLGNEMAIFTGSSAQGVERVRVDVDGNVGIGTSSPAANLHVDASAPEFRLSQSGTAKVRLRTTGDNYINTGQNLGIGTTSPSQLLHVNGTARATTVLSGDGTASAPAYAFSNDTDTGIFRPFPDTLAFSEGGVERMRINSSGNVGIGTSSPDYKGHIQYTKTSDNTIGLRVEASATAYDGKVISWGEGTVENGVLGWADGFGLDSCYIASGIAGLRFQREFGSSPRITPCNNSGVLSDNAIDLGASNARFDDIYATNTSIISSSDSTLKQDIEELTDAEERVAIACKGLLRKFRWISSVEEKGDDARIHFGIMAQDLRDAFTAEGLDAGRYGMFISSTWWEHEGEHYPTAESAPEGATEVTRLGVRYSELLAFIISAI